MPHQRTWIIVLSVAFAAIFGGLNDASAADGKKTYRGWPIVKAGKGEKVCRYKFPSGEKRAWVCKKEEPCCAWDAISYVKCGSTITGCL